MWRGGWGVICYVLFAPSPRHPRASQQEEGEQVIEKETKSDLGEDCLNATIAACGGRSQRPQLDTDVAVSGMSDGECGVGCEGALHFAASCWASFCWDGFCQAAVLSLPYPALHRA